MWPRITTAPAIASATAGTVNEPPGRSVAPRRTESTIPATISPIPSTTGHEKPNAPRSAMAESATRTIAKTGRRPLAQSQSAR